MLCQTLDVYCILPVLEVGKWLIAGQKHIGECLFDAVLFVSGDPTNDANIYGDPFKTLFVARIVSIFFASDFAYGIL